MRLRPMRISRHLIRIVFALAVAIAISLVSYFRIFEVFELATLDLRFKLRPPQKVSDKIAIIEISNDTLNQIGTWPIDREYHAYLIDILTRYKTRSIIFDMLFTKEQNPVSDKKLIDSTRSSQRTYLGCVFRLSNKISIFPVAEDIEALPLPQLLKAARGIGHINITGDIDGKRRSVPLFIKHKGGLVPQLSMLAVCDYFGKNLGELEIIPKKYVKLTPAVKIPIDENGMTLINFAGRWQDTFKHYSFIDILKSDVQIQNGEKPRVDLNELSDKICIVGLTAVGTPDLHPTPVQTDYPMVGVHANIINSVLNNSFIFRVSRQVNIFILILLGLITIFSVLRLRPLHSLLCVLSIVLFFTLAAFAFFIIFNLWIDLFYPLILISVMYLFATFYKYISERNKRMIMEKELDIARNIQKSFLKEAPPAKQGLEIAVRMDTAKAVGGDLYDFVDMPEGRIGIMIGDVSGKGVPAALFMAKTVSEFRFHSRTQSLPEQTLSELNNTVSLESTSGLFVTIFYMILDMKQKEIHMADAGHLPVIIAHREGPTEALKIKGQMAVGIMDGIEYTQRVIGFNPGGYFSALYGRSYRGAECQKRGIRAGKAYRVGF